MKVPLRGPWPAAALALAAVLLGTLAYQHWHELRLEAQLVREDPDRVVHDPRLVAVALRLARPAYARQCAACHGRDLHGARRPGVPDLTSPVWLYGTGDVSDIEPTILYGIRSGHPKARNITDMPAFGRTGQLSPAEIRDVAEYVYSLSHADVDAAAVGRGRAIFADKGVCYDCHGADASGNIDYGAPDLTGKSQGWLYGGDRATLIDSIKNGRHGLCPAWIHDLSPAQIRALAVYLYEASRPAADARTAMTAAGAPAVTR